MSGFLVKLCRFMRFQALLRINRPSHWWHKTSEDRQGSHFDVLFCRSTFKEFLDKYGKDPRFKQVLKRKDQELFFTQFISTLKKRDKENRMRLRKMRWVFADRDLKSPHYCDLISCDCLLQRIRCDAICPYVWPNAKGSVAVCFSNKGTNTEPAGSGQQFGN